jgi:hypothetical protein
LGFIVSKHLFKFLSKRFQIPYLADRLPKLSEVIKEKSGAVYYHRQISPWKELSQLVLGAIEPQTIFDVSGMVRISVIMAAD